MTRLTLSCLVGALTVLSSSCGDSGPRGDMERVGSARIALANAPVDAPCLQIAVAGSRTIVEKFPLAPGESTTFLLGGLSLGVDQFSGLAYPTSCGTVTADSVASWVSDPIVATLAAGIVVDIPLVMHRNGRANVSIVFQDDPDAGATPAEAGQPLDATADATSCSPAAVLATGAQAAAAVKTLLDSGDTFCLPGQTTGSISVCSTAACANAPNSCVATLGLTTFAFDPATLSFTASANITVSGGAVAALSGISLTCNDLVVTAPGTSFAGTLVPTQPLPGASPSNGVLFTVSNVVVHTMSLSSMGCGALDAGTLNAAAAFFKGTIEANAASRLQGRTFVLPCAGLAGAIGTDGAASALASVGK